MTSTLFVKLARALSINQSAVEAVVSLSDSRAHFILQDGGLACLLHVPPGSEVMLSEDLRKMVASHRQGWLWLVAVGGGKDVQKMLSDAQPSWMINRRVGVAQIDYEGKLWLGSSTPSGHRLVAALRQFEKDPGPDLGTDDLRKLSLAIDQGARKMTELVSFARRLEKTKPWATFSVAAFCAAALCIQIACGAVDFVPGLVRMGANLPRQLIGNEWYRLFSSMFLHGSIEHIICNLVVLISLGGFLERLLGTRRFLVLYGLSGLAGSLASTFFSRGIASVGASGALWGMLGASAVLAFRPTGLIPAVNLQQLRQRAMINLGINLLVSFMPNIDLACHLGGGAMGALLMTLGWLRPLEKSESTDKHEIRGLDWKNQGLTVSAVSISILMGVCLILALWTGKPWLLRKTDEWTRQTIGATGASVELPSILTPTPKAQPPENMTMVSFGKIERDPCVVEVLVFVSPTELSAEQMQSEWETMLSAWKDNIPAGTKRLGSMQQKEIGQVKTVEDDLVMQNGIKVKSLGRISPHGGIRVNIIYFPNSQFVNATSVEHILKSIEF